MPHDNLNNPYSHNNNANPYGNSNDTYGSNQLNQQRQLQKEQEQRQYKQYCEVSFDSIVSDYKSSKRNEVEFIIDEANQSSIVRYFKRYRDNKFISLSLVILIMTAIFSFYSIYASLSILLVFLVKVGYSQSSFTRYFLNDANVSKEEIKEIESLIFGNKLNVKTIFVISVCLTTISMIVYIFSMNIFIDAYKYEKLISFLSKFEEFKIKNELFSYFNMFSISILMLLKTVEKWHK